MTNSSEMGPVSLPVPVSVCVSLSLSVSESESPPASGTSSSPPEPSPPPQLHPAQSKDKEQSARNVRLMTELYPRGRTEAGNSTRTPALETDVRPERRGVLGERLGIVRVGVDVRVAPALDAIVRLAVAVVVEAVALLGGGRRRVTLAPAAVRARALPRAPAVVAGFLCPVL